MVVSGKKSVMSTNHCARTSCWWFLACAPHLWFVHLPNWHFSLHLPHLQRPDICVVENFQRFRSGILPTSSQERVKQKSMLTFTFTFLTIYEVNGTAWYLVRCLPATDYYAILTLYIIHTLSLTLSALYRASTYPVSIMSHGKLYCGADVLPLAPPLIRLLLFWPPTPWFDTCLLRKMRHDSSLHPSTYPFIDPLIYPWIHPSIHRSIHQSVDRYIHPSIYPSIHQSIDRSTNQSINQ